SGFVQRRLKAPGDKVMRNMDAPHSMHLVHLYDPNRLQVRVDVPLADAAHVFVGQHCEIVVEALPDRVFKGEVLRTTHEADLQKNTLQMKVKIIDPDPILRPEMLSRVKFLPGGVSAGQGAAAPAGSRVLVPIDALDHRDGSARVWTVTHRKASRGALHSVAVERLGAENGWVTLAGDIQPGALVALDHATAREGERVEFRLAREEDPS
ncbi:MAG: efflux RND transporter periplasmic adaptor subunit, partial [Planctomycetota bacterium]